MTVTPRGHGRDYGVEVADSAGIALASCDAEGTVRDQSGDVLMRAPIDWSGRGDRPTDAGLEVKDEEGRALGSARVVKYGLGPRARKATVTILGPQSVEAARLEARDRKGEELAVTSNGTELATLAVAKVKRGLLRSSRIYAVEVSGDLSDPLRRLVLAASIRYDALLNAVVAASARD